MNYKHDYINANPLQNYYSNIPIDPKAAQIKSIKSSENIFFSKPEPKLPKAASVKKTFIEPGNPCQNFQQILSTTCVNENGGHILHRKGLKRPIAQLCKSIVQKKQPAKKPTKKYLKFSKQITGDLNPHLQKYATITHEGLYRQQNQDKITIYLEENYKWFSIYDGSKCSQFLKEKLHELEKDVPNALRKSFVEADEEWKKKGDNSGSCALVIFIHSNAIQGPLQSALNSISATIIRQSQYVYLTDGFAVHLVFRLYQISKDHKPSNMEQEKRIFEASGKIYQTTAVTQLSEGFVDIITGPLRVFPGRLSTTRTFGGLIFYYDRCKNITLSRIYTILNVPNRDKSLVIVFYYLESALFKTLTLRYAMPQCIIDLISWKFQSKMRSMKVVLRQVKQNLIFNQEYQ